MAPVLRATTSTSPTGTNRNSASRSTNVRMSQGQATRSTFTLARVTHFIAASSGWYDGLSPSNVFSFRISTVRRFAELVGLAQRVGLDLIVCIIYFQGGNTCII